MNTYHGTMTVGDKTYRVTAKADTYQEAAQKVATVAASAFPGKTANIVLIPPERIGEGGLEFLKNIFGIK